MKWNEFNEQEIDCFALTRHKKTNIECPMCGGKVYFDSCVLASYPAKYFYWCKCGWSGYSAIKWKGEQE